MFSATSLVALSALASCGGGDDDNANGIENLLPSPTLSYMTLVISGRLRGANGELPNQAREALIQPAFLADTQNNPDDPRFRDGQLTICLTGHLLPRCCCQGTKK